MNGALGSIPATSALNKTEEDLVMTQVEKAAGEGAPRPGLLGTLHSPALQWGGALDLRASLQVLHPSLDDGNRVLNLSLSLSLPEHFGEPSGHLTIVSV